MRGSKTSVGEHRDSLQSLLSTLCSEERGIPLLRQSTARGAQSTAPVHSQRRSSINTILNAVFSRFPDVLVLCQKCFNWLSTARTWKTSQKSPIPTYTHNLEMTGATITPKEIKACLLKTKAHPCHTRSCSRTGKMPILAVWLMWG